MSTRPRTLWEEGRQPGRLVVLAASALTFVVVLIDVALTSGLSLLFDLSFVVVCLGAALTVRPRDFFPVGVLPPLLMLGVVVALVVAARGAVADPVDGALQAIVSGLAHHAGPLLVGYLLVLGVLALRQVAQRNAGRISVSSPR